MSIHHTERPTGFIRSLLLPVILLMLLGPASHAAAQESDSGFVLPPQEMIEDSLTQAISAAEMLFNDGLTTMNEDTLRRAAAQYEQIIVDYSHDPRHIDAYFSSAYIHLEYLQGLQDYEHARNLLTLLITNYPSNYVWVTDALLTLAHLDYRCLRDPASARESLDAVLTNYFLSGELGSRDIEAKVLLAKCLQKLEEYDTALALWEELALSNPELDTEGRLEWIRNSDNWLVIDDGRISLYFYNAIARETYTRCLADLRDGLSRAESAWGLMPGGPIDVYLYASIDQLFDHTLRSDGFALPTDGEIHMSVADIPNIGHLTGWLVSQRLNSRPDATVFPLLRAGFDHYFMAPRDEIDSLAAGEIYYYHGRIPDDGLLFPLSLDYTFSEEYGAMASSFMHYLIEEGRVSTEDLKEFYRLLWANPGGRWHAPLMSALMRLNLEEGSAASWQQSLLTPAQVDDLFRNVLGVDISGELETWQNGLAAEIALVEAELGSLSTEVQRVTVDLTSPESALESWWEAYRAGDLNALMEASTRDVASLISDARDIYEEEGILDQVIQDHFIRPYRGARMVVVQSVSYAANIYVFEVRIESGDSIEEMTILVRREGDDWKVDSN